MPLAAAVVAYDEKADVGLGGWVSCSGSGVGGIAATIGCGMLIGCGDDAAQAPSPPTVEVATPERRAVTSYYHYTGNLESVNSVEVRARVSGVLEAMLFEVSSPVEAGDKLFNIEPVPYDIGIQSAQAAVNSAQAAVELATIGRDQIQEALKPGRPTSGSCKRSGPHC